MRITALIIIVSLFAFSCSNKKHNFKVEMRIKGAKESTVFLAKRTISGTIPVDSAVPDKKGNCKLEGFTKEADFYIVYAHPRQFINLIIHPGDDFRVLTDAHSFDVNYIIEGSKDSRLIQKLVNMQTRTLGQITEISERYENSMEQPDFPQIKAEIDSIYNQIVSTHKNFSIQLIEENKESLATLMALYQQLGRNEPVFDPKKDFQYYEMVDAHLSPLYPNSEAVIDLDRKVTELREMVHIEIGSEAPEIALPDSAKKIISTSAFHGKKVLLFFWASWSDESTSELSAYTALYPLAVKNQVEYFQISLDKTRTSWIKCMSEIPARGIHVCDFNYWDSPAARAYHIHKLPAVFLLDETGKIIRKGFSAAEFAEILKNNSLN